MTNRTKKAVLAGCAALLLLVGVVVYRTYFKPPMLVWNPSPGATHYEVQIDGTLLGTYTETHVKLPAGFTAEGHTVQVRACIGSSCSPWQLLTER